MEKRISLILKFCVIVIKLIDYLGIQSFFTGWKLNNKLPAYGTEILIFAI